MPSYNALFTDRQRQVLALLATGAKQTRVAERLGISTKAVYHATQRARERIGVGSNEELLSKFREWSGSK